MTSRFIALLPLACAAAIACGREQPVEPGPGGAGTTPTRVLGSVEMRPALSTMSPGDTLQLVVEVKDQFGSPLGGSRDITFTSSNPAAAVVSGTGLVTALEQGESGITATVTERDRIRGAFMTMNIVGPPVPLLQLRMGSQGWQPSAAELAAGGVVRWTVDWSWSGTRHRMLYFSNEDWRIVDSLDLSSGTATRTFPTPGTLRYCSGGCWDPPDGGVIYVR